MSNKLTIPLAIIFGGIIVAVALYVSVPKGSPSTGNPSLVRPVGVSDHILGNPAAKVMLVEYADFDCEYCKGFDETLHQIIADEGATGEVAWTYREFPLSEIHPNALRHAEAAECAALSAGNEAFWKFKTELFKHQPIDPQQYGTFAKNVGISSEAFADCFAKAATTVDARIQADRKNALDMGAQGTPYTLILVAGKPPVVMTGANPYGVVKQLVDEALSN
ncbi:MAG: thioredoxin domain-containing protein [Candidatus Paceibacterota bacterium]|jgi:protein-disulfide isomerase